MEDSIFDDDLQSCVDLDEFDKKISKKNKSLKSVLSGNPKKKVSIVSN
jgi:hypothetical protein